MSEAASDQPSHRPGRHRRSAGAGTWTPVVDKGSGGGRHKAPDPAPAEVAVTTAAAFSADQATPEVIWPPESLEDFWPPESGEEAFTAIVEPGQQVLEEAAVEPQADELPAEVTEEHTDIPPALRRTAITFAPEAESDYTEYVYAAPPADGLGKFDIGTVPASVTPPSSWRKAAWFATVSSTGVVVALLVAGTYFVGQPVDDRASIDGWTGIRGDQPELHDEGFSGPSSARAKRSTAEDRAESSAPQRINDVAGVRSSSKPGSSSASRTTATGGPATPTSAQTTAPTTTTQPQKPSPRPASRETRSAAVYRFPPDAETMGDRSEIFLNEITENPERAHEQTGGELYEEGAESIARRYSHIAYFEVEHIYIDQRNRTTINEVKVVYTDGSTERQQRTLRFEDGDKITHD